MSKTISVSQLPSTIRRIGEAAFEDAHLTMVQFPTSLKIIDRKAFNNCRLESIILPESVISVGEKAFARNEDVANLSIASSTVVHKNAFTPNSDIYITSLPTSIVEDNSAHYGLSPKAVAKYYKRKKTAEATTEPKETMMVPMKAPLSEVPAEKAVYESVEDEEEYEEYEDDREIIMKQQSGLEIMEVSVGSEGDATVWGFNYNMIFKHFYLGFGWLITSEESEYIKDFNSYWPSVGLNYRLHLNTHLYVDARGGLGYGWSTWKVKTYNSRGQSDYEKNSDGDVFFQFNPKVGLQFTKGIALVAGYKLLADKFKFEENSITNLFTVGIAVCF